jgi:glutamate-1-semialdehyde aminotransferase
VPAGLDAQVLEFDANDPDTLSAVFRTQPRDIAAVIIAPEMVLPFQPELLHAVARITREHEALLIMDEVKTALRIFPGSVSARIGLVPDLITVSKALGNGWPIALTAGRRDVMEAGAGMHYSATFHGETAAMAAALETLRLIEEQGVQQHVERLGQLLLDGLNRLIARLDVPAIAYPEPLAAMPFFRFTHPDRARCELLTAWFFREVLARGELLHPRHLWFISGAHQVEDIDRTLEACDFALRQALAFVPI